MVGDKSTVGTDPGEYPRGPKGAGAIAKTTKVRQIRPKVESGGTLRYWRVGPGQPPTVTTVRNYPGIPKSWLGTQVTASESHPGWKTHHKGVFQGDQGGDFLTTKQFMEGIITSTTLQGRNVVIPPSIYNVAEYDGVVLPVAPGSTAFPPMPTSSDTELKAWGTKAIAICKPTNPVADVSTFLGELLRDGIPKAIGTTLATAKDFVALAKSSGDEYLNVEFGWDPFIRDLRQFSHAVTRADKILYQYEKDSGSVVRRRMSFAPVKVGSADVVTSGVAPYIYADHAALHVTGVGQGKVIKTRSTTTNRWFSGAFTYYLPRDANSVRGRLGGAVQDAKKLLGLSLTPDTVWNLTPWSWATDWLFNTGDVISNLTDWAIDGLTMKYGYIMEHSKTVDRYTFTGDTDFQSRSVYPGVVSMTSESKKRLRASPFGFGLTWDGFSAQQKAIASALGLTHGLK